ncbi:putative RNA-directed DNA polymerase from transposon X-element [Trichonephila clavipes]|nr:putative RNA-directed DNA polymerase from transposon X-element [Trichonephila clavipes]
MPVKVSLPHDNNMTPTTNAKLTFAHHIEQTRKKAQAVHAVLKRLISRRSKLAIRHKSEDSAVKQSHHLCDLIGRPFAPENWAGNGTRSENKRPDSNKAFLFGHFNARHPSWNPGRANSNGNILCNWAVGSALDILAPDTPTHFNSRHSNAILDIGFAVNLSHTEVFTINTLSSDHNPVIFDFVTNNALPPILRTLKTTNWIKFQEIISHTIPGNPRIDDLDLAVQNFTSNISNAISASTSTRLITTPHLRLPENIRELIRAKNRFRKL